MKGNSGLSDSTDKVNDDVNAKRSNGIWRRIGSRLLIVAVALVCALLLLEVIVQFAGEETEEGQFVFAGVPLQPYALSINRLAEQVAEYEDNLDLVTLIYDEFVGWKFRPNSTRQNGEFSINSAGLRSLREYDIQPLADTLRIALFGDSFTAGDDARDEDAWSQLLEVNLNQAGIRTEVLNFGVSAYGMDQAFLRWRHEGSEYAPDIVVFGWQAENLDRNVNVFRQLIHPLGPPFSKPRFVLADDDLQLVNSPTIPPSDLVAAFENFGDNPLAVHEAYYRSRDYVKQWWSGSKLISYINSVVRRQVEHSQVRYAPDSERGRLGKAIVDAFAADVSRQGKAFVVVFLPHKDHVSRVVNGRPIPYAYLLEDLSEKYHFLSLADRLEPEHKEDSYWGATLHYGPELNQLLAELVAGEIIDCVENAACPLTRFDDVSSIYTAGALAGE